MKINNSSIEISQYANGDSLSINVIQYDSLQSGPHIYFQANVHGAELQGNIVIKLLMEYFKEHEFRGKITFVPFANPMSVNAKIGGYTYGRFNPRTGDNWNRNYIDISQSSRYQIQHSIADFVNEHYESETIITDFKQYLDSVFSSVKNNTEYGLSENKIFNVELQHLAADADVIFDLHTGGRAARYLYAAEYEKSKAMELGFPHTLIIPNEFDGAMDEACFMPWVHLQNELMNHDVQFSIPVQAYTVELGSEETISMDAAKEDMLRLLIFLKGSGQHSQQLEELKGQCYSCHLKNYRSYYAPTGGLCEFHLEPAEHFLKHDKLASIHSFNSKSNEWMTNHVVAKNNGIMINIGTSANISQGETLFQVMEHYHSFEV